MQRNHETRIVYNHSDSYPTWLGERMVEHIQTSDLDADGEAFFALTIVDESESPTPEQLADLKARGFWRNVSSGDDWYSALRDCQGNLAKYIQAGYLPAMDNSVLTVKDIFIEWGYVIDLDERALVVYDSNVVIARIPFFEIRSGKYDKTREMDRLESLND